MSKKSTSEPALEEVPAPSPTPREIEHLTIAELRAMAHGGNPKLHGVPAIAASIARFGFTVPVLVDGQTGVLTAGHGRLAAVARLFAEGAPYQPTGEKWPWPPSGIRVREDGQWLVPVLRHTFTSDVERDAYLIADNRLTEAGGWDDKALRSLMVRLAGSDSMDLESIGYTAKEFNALMAGFRISPTSKEKRNGERGDSGLIYKVVVTCTDEMQQADLLERLEGEGYDVTSLIA
jgi:hypothetical protein